MSRSVMHVDIGSAGTVATCSEDGNVCLIKIHNVSCDLREQAAAFFIFVKIFSFFGRKTKCSAA